MLLRIGSVQSNRDQGGLLAVLVVIEPGSVGVERDDGIVSHREPGPGWNSHDPIGIAAARRLPEEVEVLLRLRLFASLFDVATCRVRDLGAITRPGGARVPTGNLGQGPGRSTTHL